MDPELKAIYFGPFGKYREEEYMTESGYTPCACRDCMEIAISTDMRRPDLCWECEEAGCEKHNGECEREDAYGTE